MQPLVLLILDGYGLSSQVEGNAIFSTPTPNFDQLLSYFPHASLHASGEEVGLSWGEMGNSEVGHLNLGTGRIIMQDLGRINKSITDGTFFNNQVLIDAYKKVLEKKSNLHLIGLVSNGGVHSHTDHLYALLKMAKDKGVSNVFVHMITDGRDTPPKVALQDLKALEAKFQELEVGKIATVGGRYFAMDRDKRWDRVQKAYDAMFTDGTPTAPSAAEGIQSAYNNNKTDEFVEPISIAGTPKIKDGDSIIFFNFRADRAKQISDAIINADFNSFSRSKVLKDYYFVSFTSYGHEPSPMVKVAFFAASVTNQIAKVISEAGLTQLHVAETEKYPHVTYFFNGGVEAPLTGEERLLIQSPKVATYDLKPEMSVAEVATNFANTFQTKKPAFTVINFANADMVGHTGIFDATCKAIAAVDVALGHVSNASLKAGANLIITADHGNAEQMVNPQTKEVDKEHTTNPVPLVLALPERRNQSPVSIDINYKMAYAAGSPAGVLADVSATCLDVLGLQKPAEITGQSLKTVF